MSTTLNIIGPSSIVTSLELSKKLKEAGWPQEYDDDSCTLPHPDHGTYFCWENEERPCTSFACNCGKTHGKWKVNKREDNNFNPFFAAPTVEEVLRKLPPTMLRKNGNTYSLHFQRKNLFEDGWEVSYYRVKDGMELAPATLPAFADTLANAAAAMFCYLAEHNLLPTS